MSCVLCKRSCEVFNVNTIYGNANRSVRDYLTEILGIVSESYLCSTDCVCDVCMNLLKHVAKLKWKLRKIIVNENESLLPISLGKIWKLFADKENDGVSGRTPDVLVSNFEKQTEIRARKRSLSRSSGVGPSDLSESSEIIEAFDHKRRKGRERKRDHFYCTEANCPLYFGDLDVLNCHRILHHNILALHFCDECSQKYTTAEHLNLHRKVHSVGPFWCLMCSAELENQETLQKHLQQHVTYSVPCRYCDKSFLNQTLLEGHVLKAHSIKKTVFSRKNIIIDRVDTFEVNEPVEKKKSREKSRYKVFVSPFTDMECHFNEQDCAELKKRLMGSGSDTGVSPGGIDSIIIESEPGDASSEES